MPSLVILLLAAGVVDGTFGVPYTSKVATQNGRVHNGSREMMKI